MSSTYQERCGLNVGLMLGSGYGGVLRHFVICSTRCCVVVLCFFCCFLWGGVRLACCVLSFPDDSMMCYCLCATTPLLVISSIVWTSMVSNTEGEQISHRVWCHTYHISVQSYMSCYITEYIYIIHIYVHTR